ncbi:MAG: extracellular solute-binding protein [Magnetococcus sp. WYHC-3]
MLLLRHVFMALVLLWATPSLAAHGLSLDGTLKYGPDFQRFDYTSAQAKPGGTLTLHAMGSFDKMNPYSLKGEGPSLLGSLVFETLMLGSDDEVFSQYGLLARDVEVAADASWVTFTLDPAARWSDGVPVSADDVVYSLEILRSEAADPSYHAYFRDILRAEVLSPQRVRLHFRAPPPDSAPNRELPLIAGQLPVLPKHWFTQHPFGSDDLTPPPGSGPYVVESLEPGKTITYRRNPRYWGWERPTRRGWFNFERVVVKYFKDPVVALEAFKAGEFDFFTVVNSKEWARDYVGPRFDSGEIRKESLPHRNGAGMQGLAFNLRRGKFQDRRVREALSLAFDFEWSNQNLFHGQYVRSDSYFSNDPALAAAPVASAAVLDLLKPVATLLQEEGITLEEVTGTPVMAPSTRPPGSLRDNLRRAQSLLKEAGWTLGPDRILTHPRHGPLVLEAMLSQPAFERIMAPYARNLERLGVRLDYRTVDISLYLRRMRQFDFDMVVTSFAQSASPGNEQRGYWHSDTADTPGGGNLLGLKSKAVDHLVERLIHAPNRAALEAACQALDRVLRAGRYLVPNWHINTHRIAYWNRFQRPDTLPERYTAEGWLFTWWLREADRPPP